MTARATECPPVVEITPAVVRLEGSNRLRPLCGLELRGVAHCGRYDSPWTCTFARAPARLNPRHGLQRPTEGAG